MTHHLVTFVFACAALASLRACQCNLRHWRQHRRRPLILAPADELPVEAEWPLPDYRWPRPSAQAPGPLDPKLCAVYARLCRERAIIWRGIGQASIVVGGAWLGLQLPDLTHYFVAEASRPRTSIPWATWDYWANAVPFAVVVLGIAALVHTSAQFDMAQIVYRRAAERPRDGTMHPTSHRALGTRIWDWLIR